MSFEEFRAEQLSEMDPKKLAANREQAEKSIQNHYRFYQEKQAELGISSVFSIFGGMFAPKIAPRSMNTAKPTSQNSAMVSEKPASVVKTSVNPPANPNVAEKKTPNFMKPTGSSNARARVIETKPLNPQHRSSQNPLPEKTGKQEVVREVKKPVSQMTNQEFVQEIANRAERKIGGSGAVSGTKKHSYAKDLGKRAQKMLGERELKFEKSYINNKPRDLGDPVKGSTRLDVYDSKNQVVYDYKFVQDPGKGLKQNQINKIKEQGPKPLQDVIEINPKKE